MSTKETGASAQDTSQDMSLKELILRVKIWWSFIVSKWLIVLIFILLGSLVGFIIYNNTEKVYVANCTFTLDEGGESSSQANGLALLGIGGTSEGGLFQGKNLIWLYSSRLMIEKALLRKIDSTRNEKLFIDWFLEVDKKGQIALANNKGIKFMPYNDTMVMTKEQSSLISFVEDLIKGKYLSVTETKNTENFITVTFKHRNEVFAKMFSDVLVSTVNDFYVSSKTKKIRTEIEILQNKAINFRGDMDRSMLQTAVAYDNTPYPNISRQVAQVAPQKKQVDVEVNSALYVEMVKNLELNKMMLAKATPLIQVIDAPRLPLEAIQQSLIMSLVYGGLIAALLIIIILTMIRVYRNLLRS